MQTNTELSGSERLVGQRKSLTYTLKKNISSRIRSKSINIYQADDSDAGRQQRTVTNASPIKKQKKDVENSSNTTSPNKDNPKQTISYWHYKQTGVKSRPIKLIKHPIEHIERKIVISYLLGFLFKLIAIFTGPLIVLAAYLLTVPFVAVKRSIWFLLNLEFLADARIKTRELTHDQLNKIISNSKGDSDDNRRANKKVSNLERQLYWNYCPLSFIETYWFKERLVNTVILVVDNSERSEFSIKKIKCLVKENILARPTYRKFLSRVVAKGFPLYKSYYWHHLDLADDHELQQHDDSNSSPQFEGSNVDNNNNHLESQRSSAKKQHPPVAPSNTSVDSASSIEQFSIESSETTTPETCEENVKISMPSNLSKDDDEHTGKVYLNNHIYLDGSLHKSKVTCASIRRHAYNLLNVNLSLARPLWELRAIPASNGKTYLIFRCHQCLADGKSLTKILTDHLTTLPIIESTQCSSIKLLGNLDITCPDDNQSFEMTPTATSSKQFNQQRQPEEDESVLKPIKAKRSFISRVSRANSLRSAVFVGPLTVLLWVIWTFTRRKNNHLNKCLQPKHRASSNNGTVSSPAPSVDCHDQRRFYMTHYNLTKFYQIKQMTRSTVSDVILCALSGALRDYLRKFNGVSNPPNLNASITVDMRQPGCNNNNKNERGFEQCSSPSSYNHQTTGVACSSMTNEPSSPMQSKEFSSFINESFISTKNEAEVNCTLVNVPLATSIEGTVPRLWEIRGIMDELRTSADPWVILGLQQFLFTILPSSWYQRVINYIALRNSSIFMSNIHGPVNMVESWCVDLFQRALFEAQQSAQTTRYQLYSSTETDKANSNEKQFESKRLKSKRNKASRLKFMNNLGSISSIYYCMQPPTSDIPISFNCITYHDKLFVTSLSRSLLVEDSKLLIRLFFKQLDQLANTVAKRRNLFTIIRGPVPVEISCQPASPTAVERALIPIELTQDDYRGTDDEQEKDEEIIKPSKAGQSSHLIGFHKDDIEANVGTSGRTNRCSTCHQPVCTCRRRKSLFSFDQGRQRAVNLVNLLHPSYLKALHSKSREKIQEQEDIASANECLCGQKLLEELDEEDSGGDLENDEREVSSGGSQTPSEPCLKVRRSSIARPCCAKCRAISQRSTLSLNTGSEKQRRHRSNLDQHIHDDPDSSIDRSNSSIDGSKGRNTHTSAQLIIPDNDKFNTKLHSKSETDLRPMNRNEKNANQRGSKESWFMLGRMGNRKMSLFSKSSSSNQQAASSRTSVTLISSNNSNNNNNNVTSKARNFIEAPVELIYKRLGSSSKLRRQSLAADTATTRIHRAVVVKDEVRAIVRYKNLTVNNKTH